MQSPGVCTHTVVPDSVGTNHVPSCFREAAGLKGSLGGDAKAAGHVLTDNCSMPISQSLGMRMRRKKEEGPGMAKAGGTLSLHLGWNVLGLPITMATDMT